MKRLTDTGLLGVDLRRLLDEIAASEPEDEESPPDERQQA